MYAYANQKPQSNIKQLNLHLKDAVNFIYKREPLAPVSLNTFVVLMNVRYYYTNFMYNKSFQPVKTSLECKLAFTPISAVLTDLNLILTNSSFIFDCINILQSTYYWH